MKTKRSSKSNAALVSVSWHAIGLLLAALLLSQFLAARRDAAQPDRGPSIKRGRRLDLNERRAFCGGSATFATVTTNTLPFFTNNVPTGTYVPAGNSFSVGMEVIGGNTGGRAIDLVTTNVNYVGVVGTLGTNFPGLTICGWLNARSLQVGPGGNRIAECFEISGAERIRPRA